MIYMLWLEGYRIDLIGGIQLIERNVIDVRGDLIRYPFGGLSGCDKGRIDLLQASIIAHFHLSGDHQPNAAPYRRKVHGRAGEDHGVGYRNLFIVNRFEPRYQAIPKEKVQ